jgi:nitrous oxide reductase accessory protein NosL
MRVGNFPAFSRIEDAQDFAKKRGGTVMKADQISLGPYKIFTAHVSICI